MNLNIFRGCSLKTKVTLFTLAIFLACILSLAVYGKGILQETVRVLLGEQQFSTASFIAAEVNDELDYRARALETMAAGLGPKVLGNTAALQAFLEGSPVFQRLFNGGTFVTRLDGTAEASVPRSAGRAGVNYMNKDYVSTTLKDRQSTIGQPVMDRRGQVPVFGMAAPIRDAQGTVIGVLAGVTDLSQPNFLDKIARNTYGKTGGYLLVAPKHRLVVTATDKSRVMETLPAPGINSLMDRFIEGYEGSGVVTHSSGVEMLASARGIPVAGWSLIAELPTEAAYEPFRAQRKHMLLATIILSLLAGGLIWWMLRRQLAPMLSAVKTLVTLSNSDNPPLPLPVARQDEIGELIGGFNRLLGVLEQRRIALRESEDRYRTLIERSPEAILVHRGGTFVYVNPAAIGMLGAASAQDLVGKPLLDLIHPDFHRIVLARTQSVADLAATTSMLEEKFLKLDGTAIDVEVQSTAIVYDGAPAIHTVVRDITELKQAGEALRIAATAFELQEGMIITDAAKVIMRVNRAFSEITGYTAEEAIGNTPKMLSSGRHDAAFYAGMWESIQRTGGWQGEVWNRRKNGEVYPEWLTITAVKNDEGVVSHYISTLTDITLRKAAADEIQNLAFYDPLTRLPNRRLLLDRLKQALASSTRSGREGALMFIDLDNFKTLNDTLGHDKGDLLLQQVARRLTDCIREGDTAARLGGDEFVVMLENLSAEAEEAASQVEGVGEKILAALNQSYQLAGHAHHSTPSIGITLFAGHHYTVDELLKRADFAMYQAKAAGRNTLRFFDPDMQAAVTARAALESDLRKAIRKDQFILHYQAQADGEGRLTGAEALVRWQHPQRGLVSSAEFISLAEDTGLILPLGQWVLETACAQLAAWGNRPATGPPQSGGQRQRPSVAPP